MNRRKIKETVLGGLIRNNPTFVLVLGTCPTIAMTTTLAQAFAMGLATAFVLIFSNLFVSLLRNLIPIALFAVLIALAIPILCVSRFQLILVFKRFLLIFLEDIDAIHYHAGTGYGNTCRCASGKECTYRTSDNSKATDNEVRYRLTDCTCKHIHGRECKQKKEYKQPFLELSHQ